VITAYADAVNVRLGDVPGFVGGLAEPKREITHWPFAPEMEECGAIAARAGNVLGISARRLAGSSAQERDPFFAQTVVFVANSATLTSREFAAIDSTKAPSCLKRLYEVQNAAAVRKGASKPLFSEVEVSPLPSPLPRLPVYALRMTARVATSGGSGRARYYEDSFGFVRGPALITLTVAGYDPPARSSVTERRLLEVLHRRAESHEP